MKTTKAQDELLGQLENGCQVTLRDGYYTVVQDGKKVGKVWPTTFYGLFDNHMVERLTNGNYGISDQGRELLCQKRA